MSDQERFVRAARCAGFTRKQGAFLWEIAIGNLPDYHDTKDDRDFMERAKRVVSMMSPKRKRDRR